MGLVLHRMGGGTGRPVAIALPPMGSEGLTHFFSEEHSVPDADRRAKKTFVSKLVGGKWKWAKKIVDELKMVSFGGSGSKNGGGRKTTK